MLKIVIAISSYEIGGVSKIAKNLLDGLDRGKFKIILVAEKVSVRHYPVPDDVKVIDLMIVPGRNFAHKLYAFFRHVQNFRKTVLNQEPDLVFSLSYNLSCYLFFKPIRVLKDKVIIGEFSENFFHEPLCKNKKNLLIRFFYKTMMFLFYRRAKKAIVVSKSIGRHLKRAFGISEKRLRIIPTPVNLPQIRKEMREHVSDFTFDREYLYISFLSRISPEKGLKYLLRAFSRLTGEFRSRLVIIGDGESRQEMQDLSSSLGLNGDVVFLGYRDNPFKYLAKTDMFVLPSLYEGFPNVILEAYACGVPVIATRSVDGIGELIKDGESGILVDPADEESLYGAMRRLAGDRELRLRLKEAGERSVNTFDLASKLKDYEEVFLQSAQK